VHLIVPFAPGGVTDVMARILAQNLSQRWGQAVIIENRPGGNCTIADGYVAHAAPDGYTIGIILTSHTVAPSDSQYSLNYDPIKSFAPIVMLGTTQDLLVVNPTVLSVASVKELIAAAKARPGQIDFGSSGTYTPGFLNMALFMRATGIDMLNVNYMGSGPMLTAVLGGEVPLTFGTLATFLEQVKAGKLHALAVSGQTRSPLAPDVPTMLEAVGPSDPEAADLVGSNTAWYGAVAPAGTPQDIVMKIHDDMVAAMNDPDVLQRLVAQSFVRDGRSPDAFSEFLRTDIAKWTALRKANVLH
jgi:tripartite-type tricarboxylate transporter receptor subunit TctC